HHSLEQYSPEFMKETSFALNVMMRLRPDLDFKLTLEQIIASLRKKFEERIPVIQEGYEFCLKNNCAPGTSGYENWSTPSRDERILSIVAQVDQIVQIGAGFGIPTDEIWSQAKKENFLDLDGNLYNLEQLILVWQKGAYSFDPRVNPARRWALQPTGLAANLLEKTSQVISERKAKNSQQGNQCKTGCLPGSNDYNKWDTRILDKDIQEFSSLRGTYCHLFPESNCQELESSLSQMQIAVEGVSMSLTDFFRKSFFLVSDPRVTAENRWFGRKKLFDVKTLPFEILSSKSEVSSSIGGSPSSSIGGSPSSSKLRNRDMQGPGKDQYWRSARDFLGQNMLYNFDTEEIFQVKGTAAWTVHPTLPLAAAALGESLVIVRLIDKVQFAFPWIEGRDFYWMTDGSFITWTPKKLTLYSLLQNEWVETRIFESQRLWTQNASGEASELIAFQENEQIHILDFEDNTEFVVPGNFIDTINVEFRGGTKNYAYLRIQNYDSEQKIRILDLIFDRVSKVTRPGWIMPDFNGEISFSGDQRSVVIQQNEGEKFFAFVDEQGNLGPALVKNKEIYHTAPGQFISQNGSEYVLYKIMGKKLVPITNPPNLILYRQMGNYFYGFSMVNGIFKECLTNLAFKPLICGALYSIAYANQHLVVRNYERDERGFRVSLFSEATGFDIPLSLQDYKSVPINYPVFGDLQGTFMLSRSSETLILKPKAQ
ncbi:MAG: hypothetical protein AB7H97_12055, partial [Pseudobdellovibrionaceae bacterium]